MVRVVVLSFKAFRTGQANTVATLTEANTLLRLCVKSSVTLSPKPGTHYFLYSPLSITPWENHPFTLASWNKDSNGTTLNFLIKNEGGATHCMHKCMGTVDDTRSAPMKPLLEGPYGSEHHLEAYDHVLIGGGAGITAILPYVFKLRGYPTVRVHVVWAVRNLNFGTDVLAHELSRENVGNSPVDLYLSRDGSLPRLQSPGKLPSPPSPASPDTLVASPIEKLPPTSGGPKFPSQANIHFGRPDVPRILAPSAAQIRGA
jgi:predicted ferric reductase